MKYAEEHAADWGLMGQMSKMSVVGAWAERDPEAVWEWYQGQAEEDGGAMGAGNLALVTLFASMAEKMTWIWHSTAWRRSTVPER
jgi:hypothetical protein